jgi:hypothetical protein
VGLGLQVFRRKEEEVHSMVASRFRRIASRFRRIGSRSIGAVASYIGIDLACFPVRQDRSPIDWGSSQLHRQRSCLLPVEWGSRKLDRHRSCLFPGSAGSVPDRSGQYKACLPVRQDRFRIDNQFGRMASRSIVPVSRFLECTLPGSPDKRGNRSGESRQEGQ